MTYVKYLYKQNLPATEKKTCVHFGSAIGKLQYIYYHFLKYNMIFYVSI